MSESFWHAGKYFDSPEVPKKQKHVSEASKGKRHLFKDNDEVQQYIIKVWKKDPTLRKSNITVGTIHSVKGREATNVIVCDVWDSLPMKSYKNMTPFFRREEIRCAYVGVTRSKRTLYMYRPVCNSKYEDHFPLLESEKYEWRWFSQRMATWLERNWRPNKQW